MVGHTWQSRFQDILTEPISIVVGGCGGTGSHVVFLLQCLGHNVIVYDNDKFEGVNVGTQFVISEKVGMPKVHAIEETIYTMLNDVNIIGLNELYTEESKVSDIMFSCFDKMSSRRTLFENWRKNENRSLLIDLRMNALQYQLFFVTKENEEKYDKEDLFTDEEAEEPICTLKQTRHVAFIACGKAVGIFLNFLSEYVVPYKIEEDLNSLYYAINTT